MPTRTRGRAAGGVVATAVATLVGALAVPGTAAAQTAQPTLAVAPNCVPASATPARIVVVGARWSNASPVSIRYDGDGTRPLASVVPKDSTARETPGTFSSIVTVPATTSMRITATQGQAEVTVSVPAPETCPASTVVRPACLRAPGAVTFTGAGWPAGVPVTIDVDPFGPADAGETRTTTSESGTFSVNRDVPFAGAAVPIVATYSARTATGAPILTRRVSFVDPCPPLATTTTRRQPGSTTSSATTSTTRRADGSTTTATTQPPPATSPTVTLPPVPGTRPVLVRVSPRTVRPGRCAVVQVAGAPPGAPVVARFADGPPATRAVAPDGTAVVSVCVAHDSGGRLGPVAVVLAIGASPPADIVTVLRLPARPQPPLR